MTEGEGGALTLHEASHYGDAGEQLKRWAESIRYLGTVEIDR